MNDLNPAGVEAAAKAMCRAHGYDLDEPMANDGPRWRYYVPSAEAAIPAYLASLPQPEGEMAELVERLLAGPVRAGDTEDGEYELFDIEEARQAMSEAADALTSLGTQLAQAREAAIEECAKLADEQVGHTSYGYSRHTANLIVDAIRALGGRK